ncbi:XRE family transcriptional regulator [Caballeronia mineralivorans PML1(12)]|uniref:XRE family transcriptional regulator n=1 Tax=Caballeronia mineralivorans PML1(12) TaxID=908627 RepID=A0A0J1FLR1_9BURK|nr:hypothetical protein [Caballeronia mineralivorans]KLU20643.1 XRE family transcriptional regulator [Caballeronia mineralivorans PML1(12)]
MSVVNEHPGVSTLVGTPQEVRNRLSHSHAQCVLVVAFEHMKPVHLDAVTEAFANMASMLGVFVEHRDREALERLADLLVPRTPPSPRLLRETAMLVCARNAVLESGDWLTAAEVAQLAGLSTRNPSAQPNKWKKQGQIFAIHHGGVDYFPGYGLDRDAGFRPLKCLAKVIEVFDGKKDGWGLAYWFRSDNGFLSGKRPQDSLATEPERVISAARDEVQEVAHG